MKRSWQPSGILLLLIINLITPAAFAQPPPLQFQHLSDINGLSNNRVWAITQDKHGLIWIGSGDGLNRYDGYKVDVFRNEPGNRNSIPGNLIRCLFTDSQGTVWIGTSNGLAYYNDRSNSFQTFLQSKDQDSIAGNTSKIEQVMANTRKENGPWGPYLDNKTPACAIQTRCEVFE